MKHTKGPWTRDGVDIVRPGYPHLPIAKVTMGNYSHEFEANARLIAAAPEMLEALKRIAEVFPQNEELFNSVRSIIAKAEGKS